MNSIDQRLINYFRTNKLNDGANAFFESEFPEMELNYKKIISALLKEPDSFNLLARFTSLIHPYSLVHAKKDSPLHPNNRELFYMLFLLRNYNIPVTEWPKGAAQLHKLLSDFTQSSTELLSDMPEFEQTEKTIQEDGDRLYQNPKYSQMMADWAMNGGH